VAIKELQLALVVAWYKGIQLITPDDAITMKLNGYEKFLCQ